MEFLTMKQPPLLITIAIIFGLGALTFSHSTPPRLLPFQGRLTDASGTPVLNGAKAVLFEFFAERQNNCS